MRHMRWLCRLLANLYSGNVYIWNSNDQVIRCCGMYLS